MAANMHPACTMWKYILIFVLTALFIDTYLISFMAPLFNAGHFFCLNLFAKENPNQIYYQTLVCGEFPRAKSTSLDPAFLQNIRLFSISGLQFLFFERLLAIFFGHRHRPSQIWHFLISTALTLIWGMNPAVMRAWVSLLIKKTVVFERLNWPAALTSLVVGGVCLILRPEWIGSTAFQICWLAALIMQMSRWPFGLRLIAVFFAVAPLTRGFDFANLATSLSISIAKPLVVLVLFPLSIAVAVWPKTHIFVDRVWSFSFEFLHHYDQNFGIVAPEHSNVVKTSLPILYILGAHIAAFIWDGLDRKKLFWQNGLQE
jgi:hypothetical protein